MRISNQFVGGTPGLPSPIVPSGGAQSDLVGGLVDIGLDWVRKKVIGSETPSAAPTVPSAGSQVVPGLTGSSGSGGGCPGLMSVRLPNGQCVNLDDLGPGGDPALTGSIDQPSGADGYGPAVKGWYGVGIVPRVEAVTTRRCPRGMALGRDGVCYDRRRLRKSDRAWDPGTKPLLTGGERRAIARAAAAGRKLDRAKKGLKKASRALGKAC